MNLSAPFITRPVATTLLTIGIALAGMVAFFLLPVSPLPQTDVPVIQVQASMPGASPETMSSSVATPLERHLGAIADVTEMTSQSSQSSARVTLQFGLDRDIDGAARDVQAAINAARVDLPAALKSNPTYRKFNPADAPVLIMALTSPVLTPGQVYDTASTVVAQKILQIDGVGQVNVGGGSLPAVRIEMNPHALYKYGISPEDVRAALASANANSPKGAIEEGANRFQIYTNDQASHADDYRNLIIAFRDDSPVRISDIAEVNDSVEDVRTLGLYNGLPAVMLIIFKQPGSNVVDTIDRIKAQLPELRASLPSSVDLALVMDRSTTIRASLRDVERTLMISVALVIGVVFIFLRSGRATLIPGIALPVSLIGTFGAMYLLGYSLNIFTLIALTIATGFVVDDAIVVLENITRYREEGLDPLEAAKRGASEVGFTVIAMSLSLIAVFTPILLLGGIPGRLFHEFAVTLSMAILISLVMSLTLTPMMCVYILRHEEKKQPTHRSRINDFLENGFDHVHRGYEKSLAWGLRHEKIILVIFVLTIASNYPLFMNVKRGLFPTEDTGQIMGSVQADQNTSFQLMKTKMQELVDIVKTHHAISGVAAFTGGGGGPGGGSTNSGTMFVALKPLSERNRSATQVIDDLRHKTEKITGAKLFFQASQDIRAGGRQGNAQYQYTLQGDNLNDLRIWTPKLVEALKQDPALSDVNSDQQDSGLESDVIVDRDSAERYGLKFNQIDNALYDAFGQRQVSVIYNAQNQYHVVMEVAPQYAQDPETLKDLYVSTSGGAVSGTEASSLSLTSTARNANTNALANTGHGSTSTGSSISTAAETMIPLSAFSHFGTGSTALSINHQGHFVATTISFNLPDTSSLGDASQAIDATMRRLGVPTTIHGGFQGTALLFQGMSSEIIIIPGAFLVVYIVLGILYESLMHPITILLSSIPSAGVGALLALYLTNSQFDLMAIIGIILLIGIVKKNAIIMIDFALELERREGLDPRTAIERACLIRFRPIMMTTLAALLGAVPLVIGFGEGSELRHPLGWAIIGGLIVSQTLTLYTTPVIYLVFDRLRLKFSRRPAPHPEMA